MSQKPKPCKVKIYVYTHLKAIYQPATELKPFWGLPTLSQAFQEFMDYNLLELIKDKELWKMEYRLGVKPTTIKVKCATAELWEGLLPEQKEHVLFWFNNALEYRVNKLLGRLLR